ncbi:MAG: transglutaminase-like cysteine peptidase [Parvibaculum sp.]|nr:transglutaminase-like cysteine peptidase [Parvibaculum sp.]
MKAKRTLMLALLAGTSVWLAGCQTNTNNTAGMFSTQGSGNVIAANAYMPVGQQVVPPMGYISFCMSDPKQCEGGTDNPTSMAMTPERWSELNTVNDYVNSSIRQISDADNYGVSEDWSYPNANGGDCEDLAMLKRKMLIERGWSPSDLLVAVVREWDGAGHAILVVDTDKGEYVLDNKNWAVVAWNEAPYTWIKRQSRERPYIWVNLDAKTFRTATNEKIPPLGAEIPFLVAANAKRQAPTVVADNATLRPSLAMAELPQSPTAGITDVKILPEPRPTSTLVR